MDWRAAVDVILELPLSALFPILGGAGLVMWAAERDQNGNGLRLMGAGFCFFAVMAGASIACLAGLLIGLKIF